jgi:hypothetical protein
MLVPPAAVSEPCRVFRVTVNANGIQYSVFRYHLLHPPDLHDLSVCWFASYVACAAGVTLPLSPVACRLSLVGARPSAAVGRRFAPLPIDPVHSPATMHSAQCSVPCSGQIDTTRRREATRTHAHTAE